MAKKFIMYNETKTLSEYCKENNIPYYRLVYRIKHNTKNYPLGKLISMPVNEFISKKLNKVIYKNTSMSLNKALHTFYKDNGLTLTCNSGVFTRKLKRNIDPQTIFDDYCKKVLKMYYKEN